MTILLFCGPSRSGKSTLAQRLSRQIKLPYLKFPPSIHKGWSLDDPRIDLLSRAICECIDEVALHLNFILDRAWPDNVAYARLFNRKIDESYYFNRMSDMGNSLHVFYITAPLLLLQARMMDTGTGSSPSYPEIFRKTEAQLSVWDDVVAKMKASKINVHTIDNSSDIDTALKKILETTNFIKYDKL